MIPAEAIAEILGGRSVLGRQVTSLGELRDAVAAGLPKRALNNTIHVLAPEPADAKRMMFGFIPLATYKRRVRLKLSESEQTERLARVLATARHVLETPENVRHFMLSPHQLLKGERPFDVAKTELGARQVEDILWDVFYSLPI
jgi:putative toxin-antitoxin system antitoxin component (TIGR02293 family)